ncbi:hypothetical protein HPB50_025270 [Hyalomma asiaticum]|uniref:Uncharacterized protein n=1 Tax=Hyalomma asiaticum TaxID=266040 RepID=A0ACB7RX81_HYAAI|nr:hypothetical protein HPB50_025270 [Hyalomma asiaticum]
MQSGTIAAELLKTAVGIRYVLLNMLPILRLLPSYAFMSAFRKTVSKSQIAWICSRGTIDSYRRVCVEPAEGFSVAAEEERRKNEEFVQNCCPEFLRLGAVNVPDFRPTISDVDEVFVMIIEGVLFSALLLYLDGGGWSGMRGGLKKDKQVSRLVPVHDSVDEDVEAEEARIRNEVVSHSMGADVLAVLEFCKHYGNRLVVNGVSFSVSRGEILSVLGVPGSGKSTLLRMIATDVPSDRGRALMKTPHGTITMRSALPTWRTGLGYCPQSDGLLEQLTGYETLSLFARLRGVPELRIGAVVRDIAQIMALSAVIGDLVLTYSSGVRRRLSMGVALVGLPPLVILDEPTVGVDVAARRAIWEAMRGLQNETDMTVIMTSGSMEEVEGLCDRLAIMIDGEFKCIGSLSHLKAKFAQGYTMTVKTHDEYKEDYEYCSKLMRTIADTFHNCKLQQSFEGFMEYHMPDTGLPWSELFALAEAIKRKLNLLEFLIMNTTLDHVYAALARWERGRARKVAEDGSPASSASPGSPGEGVEGEGSPAPK